MRPAYLVSPHIMYLQCQQCEWSQYSIILNVLDHTHIIELINTTIGTTLALTIQVNNRK